MNTGRRLKIHEESLNTETVYAKFAIEITTDGSGGKQDPVGSTCAIINLLECVIYSLILYPLDINDSAPISHTVLSVVLQHPMTSKTNEWTAMLLALDYLLVQQPTLIDPSLVSRISIKSDNQGLLKFLNANRVMQKQFEAVLSNTAQAWIKNVVGVYPSLIDRAIDIQWIPRKVNNEADGVAGDMRYGERPTIEMPERVGRSCD